MTNDLPSESSEVMLGGASEGVVDGSGGRRRLCETAAAVFGCDAVAHAWLDVEHHGWSLCLWRHSESAAAATLGGADSRMRGDVLGGWWPASECRRCALEWIAGPYLIEVPLVSGAPSSCSILVLGRENAFTSEDMQLVTVVMAQIAVVERTVLRLESRTLQLPAGDVTEREAEVLRLLSAGLIARSIAHRMSVSERTVHKHLEHLYHKLDVHDRLSAVIRAQQLGLLDPVGIS